mgnify:CR=1 FL=1|jgi:hypothetical protein
MTVRRAASVHQLAPSERQMTARPIGAVTEPLVPTFGEQAVYFQLARARDLKGKGRIDALFQALLILVRWIAFELAPQIQHSEDTT